jgi:hypothetical protein
MHSKLIRIVKGLSLNQMIGFGCICVMKGFLNIGDLIVNYFSLFKCCTLSWKAFVTCVFLLPSKLIFSSIDKGKKSKWVKWLKTNNFKIRIISNRMHLYYSKFNNDRQYDRQSSNFFFNYFRW